MQEKNNEAVGKYEKAIEIGSDDEAMLSEFRSSLNRMKAKIFCIDSDKLLNDKKHEEAVASYQKALEMLNENNGKHSDRIKYRIARALHDWGIFLMMQGYFNDAKMKFQEVVAISSPNNPNLSSYRHNMNQSIIMVSDLNNAQCIIC